MADAARLEELRRRVRKDPASIAFAQLAEEHRRAGDYEQAIRVCRAGLAQHPGYLSARVTLGRALIELGRLDEAAAEIDRVLETAPENLAAQRARHDLYLQERQPAGIAAVAATGPVRSGADGVARGAPQHPLPPTPALSQLEAWLSAILADRRRRHAP